MLSRITLVLLSLCYSTGLRAITDSTANPVAMDKGRFYFYWGYNRDYYSRSNLHFNGPGYDFTLYDLKATDRPEKFGWVYINPGLLSIPQYNWRLGYMVTDRFHVSLGMDHMKYVVERVQPTRISGVVDASISPTYAGAYLNQPIELTPDIVWFEHTNGFNLATIDLEWLQPLYRRHRRTPALACHWNFGLGGIWVVTKTDVRIFGDGLDNDFHVSGYALTGKSGPRLTWRKHWFMLLEAKTGYASLPHVPIKNKAPEMGDHNLLFFEWYWAVGYRFGGKKGRSAHRDAALSQ